VSANGLEILDDGWLFLASLEARFHSAQIP